MDKVIDKINAWSYLTTLPKNYGNFQLEIQLTKQDKQYRIFSYCNSQTRQSFSALYNHATREFLVRVGIGLTEFCDVNFIAGTMEGFEQVLQARMQGTIKCLSIFDPQQLGYVFNQKKIVDWQFGKSLPDEFAGFKLFIRPQQPVKVLNGSYILIDYSNFAAETNLMIYYNIYRDDFSGEIRLRKMPYITGDFDAKDLSGLETQLKNNLKPVLEKLRTQIDEGLAKGELVC